MLDNMKLGLRATVLRMDAFVRSCLKGGVLGLCVMTLPAVRAAGDAPGLVKESGLSGGIIVVLDCDDGNFLADLAIDSHFLVQGLSANEADVEDIRGTIRARGLYGQVSCVHYNGTELPYVDRLINLVLSTENTKVPPEEQMRVIAPGNTLMVNIGNEWKETVKPAPAGMDEWNQFLHGADNNGVSLDDVGPPQRLRWHDAPQFGRSKALSPSVTNMVSASGRIFTIEDRATTEDVNAPVEYFLVARDAFNGIQLWKQPMKRWSNWQTNSIKSISTQQQRSLAAIGKRVYCCAEFGGPVIVFTAQTGEPIKVFEQTEETREFTIENNVLYGIRGTPYAMEGNGSVTEVELYALNLKTGLLNWTEKVATEYIGGTLAVKGTRLVYCAADRLTCLRMADAEVVWTQSLQEDVENLIRSSRKPRIRGKPQRSQPASSFRFTHNEHPTVVLTGDMVFVGLGDVIIAKDLRAGKTAWKTSLGKNYKKSPDLFVARGLVWGKNLKGHDPKTGTAVIQLTQEVTGPMSHDRCYRNRITHRYYLNSASGGTDFLRLDGKVEYPNPWVRSTCGLAVMPANDMIYTAPWVCQCAIGAMIPGFNAMYNGVGNSDERFSVNLAPRLVKGPAFGYPGGAATTPSDWPTYRCSSTRGGVTTADAPKQLARKWKVTVGPTLTAPVVNGNAVYVASRDTHTLHALDRSSGRRFWSFTAAGRIDSPPTYYRGLLVFGSRCGWVYCLRALDGQLVWKFNGLPNPSLICDGGQLESAWPVNGSVMVYQKTFYFAAGRSSFLDGGIAVFGLDPLSGRMKHSRIMQGPYRDNSRNFPIQAPGQFQLEGFRSGIFSSVNNTLFIRQQAFKPDLTPVKLGDLKTYHLMASAGFLDAFPQHRTYWTVDLNFRYGGPTGKFGAGPAGDVIAFDGTRFYEIRGYPPGRNLVGRGRGMNPVSTYSVFSGSMTGKNEKGAWTGSRRTIPAAGSWKKHWSVSTPFAGHAIAASPTTVLAAGVPLLEEYSKDDTNASYAGRRGGVALLLDAATGEKLQELRLAVAPAWDGIAIAHNHYFICLKDGSLICFSGK